jgi:[ribosomal protein S5]-alanine N-acetyltransferase
VPELPHPCESSTAAPPLAPTLETKRLRLRAITKDDETAIFDYSHDPDVGPHAGWNPHESITETRTIMKTIFLNQPTVWGITLMETDTIIGSIGLLPDPKRENDQVLMLGYALGHSYWGNGFMTELAERVIAYGFEELNLEAIAAYHFPFNEASRRVIEKCGFVYEGTLAQAERRYDGIVLDTVCHLLTRKRYNSLKTRS